MLANADACRSLGQDRRQALWDVQRTPIGRLPLFAAADARELGEEAVSRLPEMSLGEHVSIDYQTARLSLKAHPMQFLRALFASEDVLSAAEVNTARHGRYVRMAGIVLVRQRPGKGNAIFVTLEDETGVSNVLIWARDFERSRRAVMASRLMLVEGEVQRSEEGVVHLMVKRVTDRSDELARLSDRSRPTVQQLARHPRNVRTLPKSRDFH